MGVLAFEWDDDNIFHIGPHEFTPEEVEEVFAATTRSGEPVSSCTRPLVKLLMVDWLL